LNPPEQPSRFLGLDGGKYARFGTGTVVELVLGSCSRGNRGNAQFSILGEETLLVLATVVRGFCGLDTNYCLYEERDASITPHLFVRFTPGTARNGDTLDIIEVVPGRRDRSFSIVGRGRIERLLQFIAENVRPVAPDGP
jgi:hypothetical protein